MPYTPEFRWRLIELVPKGRAPEEVGRQFEPSVQAIRNWLWHADRDASRRTDGLTTDEQEGGAALRRFRRENKLLREERKYYSAYRAASGAEELAEHLGAVLPEDQRHAHQALAGDDAGGDRVGVLL